METTKELFGSYSKFLEENGVRQGTVKAFGAEMIRRGFERDRSRIDGKKQRVFVGLSLVDDVFDLWVRKCCRVGKDQKEEPKKLFNSYSQFVAQIAGGLGDDEVVRTEEAFNAKMFGRGWRLARASQQGDEWQVFSGVSLRPVGSSDDARLR